MKLLIILLLSMVSSTIFAQVQLVDSVPPMDMANYMVGSGVDILSATLGPCNGVTSGTFTQIGPENQIKLRDGVVITTSFLDTFRRTDGTILTPGIQKPRSLVTGGFYQLFTSYDTAEALMVDEDVTAVYNSLPLPNTHTGVGGTPKLSERYRCALEFDFIPHFDSVSFRYVFAGELGSENACSAAQNQIVCAFLSHAGSSIKQNIALIPGTTYPVCANTVSYAPDSIPSADTATRMPFCRNIGPGVPFGEYWRENSSSFPADSIIYAFDGWTTPLMAKGAVNPCDTYTMKIIVSFPLLPPYSYAGGVAAFIEKGSFQSYSGTGCPTDTTTAISPTKKPEDFALAFPNPFSSSFELKLQGSAVRSSYSVRLLSAQGQHLYEGSGSLRSINYELKKLAPKLPGGLYFVSITDVKGAQQVLKVSKR